MSLGHGLHVQIANAPVLLQARSVPRAWSTEPRSGDVHRPAPICMDDGNAPTADWERDASVPREKSSAERFASRRRSAGVWTRKAFTGR